jgi:hypothetical protein
MPNTHGYGRSGVLDFLVCHRGVFIAIETKAGGNLPTHLQQVEIDNVLKAGGWAIVVNEDRLDSLDGLLEEITAAADRRKLRYDRTNAHLQKQAAKQGEEGA